MIIIKSDSDIDKMRVSGKMTADTFEYIADFIKAGITTKEIDEKIELDKIIVLYNQEGFIK